MGIPIEGASQDLCDMSVVLSTSLQSSMLKKKHNNNVYHQLREAVAASFVKISHIAGTKNVTEILTKPTVGATFRKHHMSTFIVLY